MMDLSGRVALITGGAGHIAEAFGEALAELGADLCLIDIAEGRVRSRAETLAQRFGRKVSWVAADIAQESQVKSAVEQAIADHNRIDILINNAAYPPSAAELERDSLAEWEANVRLMLTAPFLIVRACVPALEESGRGSVINIASTYGLVGPNMSLYAGTDMRNPAYYGAAKGGLVQLTRYWATTLAPRVRVNAIAPGGVWRDQPQSFHERYKQRTPLDRMAGEEDFKGAVAFLASDLSAYVTGHVLTVDGGWTAW